MNPVLLSATVLLQVAYLYSRGPSSSALVWALAVSALYAFLAFTRQRWGAHLDMHLLMLGPGGLAMLLPEMLLGLACPLHASLSHLVWMSLAMWVVTMPWTWFAARCMQQARAEGYAWQSLAWDAIGMQSGMGAVHALFMLLPASLAARMLLLPELPWIGHGLMWIAMTLGMLAGTYASLELRDAGRRFVRNTF